MESYHTDDGSVGKFIHDDGSETAIKVVNSCSNFIDEAGHVQLSWVDRNKYAVFISASLGCYMACPFCHLTIKDSRYQKLQSQQVASNIKEALLFEMERRPGMRDRFVKLCWMGMGDAISQPEMVHDVTLEIMDWIMTNGYAKGLDCVDLSTVLPPVSNGWEQWFVRLNLALQKYPLNPENAKMEQAQLSTRTVYEQRSRFRLFYSLHSAIQATRDKMVPRAMPLSKAVPSLKAFSQMGPNLLLHQLFVENLNDTQEEVAALQALLAENFPAQELRVLRYNFCDRSPFKEWDHIDEAVSRLIGTHKNLKVQVSVGKEVAAACGQFLTLYPRSRPAPIVKNEQN